MIGRIAGVLLSVSPPQVLIDVAGVAYEIDLPMSDCAELSNKINSMNTIFTHLVVREDAHLLYGFISMQSRDCFRQLIKVSGIGPRIGLALLSTLSLNELEFALDNGDVTTLCRTPGIGKKMAERMLLELKGKFNLNNTFNIKSQANPSANYSIKQDIIKALISLGYNDKEINLIIKQMPDEIKDLGLGIKEALKLLNKHN